MAETHTMLCDNHQPETPRCCVLGRLRSTELAVVASFLAMPELAAGRLLSRGMCRAMDSDPVWATIARERLAGPPPTPGGGSSATPSHFYPTLHGSWKQLLRDSGLLRLIALNEWRQAAAAAQASETPATAAAAATPCGVCQWVPFVDVDSSAAAAAPLRIVRPALCDFADATCPPGHLTDASNRCRSIGFVLAEDDPAAAARLVAAVHGQLHSCLGLHLPHGATAAAASQLFGGGGDGGGGARLSVFSYFPKLSSDDGSDRLLVTFLTDTTAAAAANSHSSSSSRFASLLELTFATCATVVFLADSTHAMHTALSRRLHPQGGGHHAQHPSLQPVTRAAYSTEHNTPTFLFAGLSARIDVAGVLARVPAALASHITQRSSSVGECLVGDGTLFTRSKPFRVPAWVNPAAPVNVPASVILRMVQSFVQADRDATAAAAAAAPHAQAFLAPTTTTTTTTTTASAFHPLWSPAVVAFLCSAQERQAMQFYMRALDTDFDDMTRAGARGMAGPLCIPAEPSALVAVHHQHFYAALRSMCMTLDPVVGADCALGLKALEGLKRGISDKFRDVWVDNREISRAYCAAVFEAVFGPVLATYLAGADPPGFQHKRGLQQFFSAMQANVEAYTRLSKGHRRFDVLSEQVLDGIVPQLLAYCDAHPQHPHFRRADAVAVAKELRAVCHARMSDFARQVDGEFGQMQRLTAVYTASLGSAWAASLQTKATAFLRGEEAAADAWCYACAARTGFLLHARSRQRRPFASSSSNRSDRSELAAAAASSHPTNDLSSAIETDDGAASDAAAELSSATDLDALDAAAAAAADASDGEKDQRAMSEARKTLHEAARAAEVELRAAAQRLASNLRGTETDSFAVVAHEGEGGLQRPLSKAKRFLQAIKMKIRSW